MIDISFLLREVFRSSNYSILPAHIYSFMILLKSEDLTVLKLMKMLISS